MSLKRYHYDKGDELCYTCKFIDEYNNPNNISKIK